MPSVRHHSFGNSAIPWQDIATYFTNLTENAESLRPMAEFTEKLAESEFANEGLHGNTSMHVLRISQSRDISGNPHLRIHWENNNQQFRFIYEDGSLEPWSRVCERSEVFEVLERFLTKRARWFHRAFTKSNG